MKTLIIGDIHGNPNWRTILDNIPSDKVVFMGDYFDSFTISGKNQISNFLEIIDLKKNSEREIVLLIGNHDYHYFPYIQERYSGFQNNTHIAISQLLVENSKLMQMVHQDGKYVFSHAGVSTHFLNSVFGYDGWSVDTLEIDINELFYYKPQSFLFNGIDPYGDNVVQSPIWIRPSSLYKSNRDFLRGKIIQIHGHTEIDKIDIKGKSSGGRYYNVDTLNTSGQFLILEDDTFSVGNINDYKIDLLE
jgi:hypothetical protein